MGRKRKTGTLHGVLMRESLRRCMREIRDIYTLPSTVLPNGETAEQTAFAQVLAAHEKRKQLLKKKTKHGGAAHTGGQSQAAELQLFPVPEPTAAV